MLKAKKTYSIRDLSDFLHVAPQTVRNKLRESGLIGECIPRKKILLSVDVVMAFLAENYPGAYNIFRDEENLPGALEGDIMIYPIPQSIGKIAKVTQASGKTYYYIRQLPLYYDADGKLVYYTGKGFSSKKKAEQARKAIIKKRNAGLLKFEVLQGEAAIQEKTFPISVNRKKNKPAPKEETYYEFCKAFILQRDIAEKTRRDYLSIVEGRIKKSFAQTPVSKLTKGALQAFVDQYTTNLPKLNVILRMTLERLFALERIPQNFYQQLIRSQKKPPRKKKCALTVKQMEQFLAYFKGHRIEHAMYLIFYTGLREGELLALWWKDIELLNSERGIVHVHASWGLTEIGYERKATKTGLTRDVPFRSAYLVSLLKKAKEESKSKWVVENSRGTGPIDSQNFSKRYFKQVSQALGFNPPITSHYARHTYISYLINKNVSPTTTAKLAGHTTTEMVIRVYAHPIEDKEKEMEAVSNLYSD